MSKPGSLKRLFGDDAVLKDGVDNDHLTVKQPRTNFKLRTLSHLDDTRTNDEVHSSISIDPVAITLVDTPYFQRLRTLKQLGTSEMVFMNTNHTRFEHSLGVYYLAGNMVRRIDGRQPNLGCTPKDILCVSLGTYRI
jgi:hypothetical protein